MSESRKPLHRYLTPDTWPTWIGLGLLRMVWMPKMLKEELKERLEKRGEELADEQDERQTVIALFPNQKYSAEEQQER